MRGRVENLRPQNTRTKEEQRKIAQQGGKRSGEVRKEKKLMSQIYAELLADQAGIKGGKGFKEVVREIINNPDPRCVSARVTLMKEIREATEGSNMKVEGGIIIKIDSDDNAL